MPTYAFVCQKGHTFDVFGHMADPPKLAPCEIPRCEATGTRDWAEECKTKHIGFVDGASLAFLPRASGAPLAGDERHPTQRVIRNKYHFSEMCKENDWTDLSNSSGPPE